MLRYLARSLLAGLSLTLLVGAAHAAPVRIGTTSTFEGCFRGGRVQATTLQLRSKLSDCP